MPRGRCGRRLVVGGIAVVGIAASATSAVALTRGGAASYRYATATRATVRQTLTTTGTLSPARAQDLDFQVAGTVGRVRVHRGSTVVAGQAVARLDRSGLRAARTSASSTLDQARSSLASDESSQSATTTTSAPSSTTPASTPTPTPTRTSTRSPSGGSSTRGGGSASTIARGQSAVIDAQHRADQALVVARQDLAAERKACATELSGTASMTAAGTDAADCSEATATLLADQTAVQKDQQAVGAAETALSRALGASTSTSTPTASVRTSVGSVGSATDRATAASSTATSLQAQTTSTTAAATTATAAQLAADQAAIDTARAGLATARSDLRQGVLRASISGRVSSVTISRGDSVSGSSSSASPAVTIRGSRRTQVTIGLSAAAVRQVTTGMAATVNADGSTRSWPATVTSIGLTKASGSDATTSTAASSTSSTYPVVLRVSMRARHLVSGADAAVTLTLATARGVLSVPTSAVRASGDTTYVETVRHGHLTRTTVTIGARGAARTQIRSGLTRGERVVLADLSAAVPSSSTTVSRSGGLGGTGQTFGGSGGPPTGYGGGPPG